MDEERRIVVLRTPLEGGLHVVYDADAKEVIGWHLATQHARDPPLAYARRDYGVKYYQPLSANRTRLLKKILAKQHAVISREVIPAGTVFHVEHPRGEGELLVRKKETGFDILGLHVETIPFEKGGNWRAQAVKSGNLVHYFLPMKEEIKTPLKALLAKKYWKRPKLFTEVH